MTDLMDITPYNYNTILYNILDDITNQNHSELYSTFDSVNSHFLKKILEYSPYFTYTSVFNVYLIKLANQHQFDILHLIFDDSYLIKQHILRTIDDDDDTDDDIFCFEKSYRKELIRCCLITNNTPVILFFINIFDTEEMVHFLIDNYELFIAHTNKSTIVKYITKKLNYNIMNTDLVKDLLHFEKYELITLFFKYVPIETQLHIIKPLIYIEDTSIIQKIIDSGINIWHTSTDFEGLFSILGDETSDNRITNYKFLEKIGIDKTCWKYKPCYNELR